MNWKLAILLAVSIMGLAAIALFCVYLVFAKFAEEYEQTLEEDFLFLHYDTLFGKDPED